jgi:hypothetical protein
MTILRYQVLIRNQGIFYLASIFDLDCQAVGASASEAVEAARTKALATLRDFEGRIVDPPQPSQLILTRIELPTPSTQAPSTPC